MNYFSYFTEIEEHFQRRRGSLLALSTLDWALIDTWREAGLPLEAVLRGIDAAFDKRETRPTRRKQRPVNSLAWCAQAIIEQAQAMQEAAVGAQVPANSASPKDDTFSRERIAAHLQSCATAYSAHGNPGLRHAAERLLQLQQTLAAPEFKVEDLERALTMLEEKIFAALLIGTPEDELLRIREQSSRELAPYKRKMQSAQIVQVERQFLNKQLLELQKLPRLSLFYMAQD